jgi:hypothetical protein
MLYANNRNKLVSTHFGYFSLHWVHNCGLSVWFQVLEERKQGSTRVFPQIHGSWSPIHTIRVSISSAGLCAWTAHIAASARSTLDCSLRRFGLCLNVPRKLVNVTVRPPTLLRTVRCKAAREG